MAREWQQTQFGNLLAEPVRNGIYKPKQFHGRGSKVVNMGELFAYPRLRSIPMKRVELSAVEAERFDVRKGDLLFARRSLVAEGAGKCIVVLDADEPTTFESSIIRARPDPSKADSLFLFYFFNSNAGLHVLDTIRRHVAVAGITGSDLVRLEVPVPRIDEQRAIAHILGTLDDKFELNRRMNETLEAMARALFNSWFVDFDPVRAKGAGRETTLPPGCADLFPSTFWESELGETPTGWQVAYVGDLCARAAMGPFGSDIKTDNFVDAGVPIVRGGNLRDGFVDKGFVFVTEQKADELRNANAFPGDIVITHRGTLGQVGLIPSNSTFPRYVVSQSQMLLSVLPSVATPRFLFEYLRSCIGQHQLLANTSQTGVPAIARPITSLKAIRLVVPPLTLLQAHERLVSPLIARTTANQLESRALSAVRDTLLPKLISGELRVKDGERIIAEGT